MPVKVLKPVRLPASVLGRDGPDDVGRPPPVAAVEDGEQVGAAVLVDDVVGLVEQEGRDAPRQ